MHLIVYLNNGYMDFVLKNYNFKKIDLGFTIVIHETVKNSQQIYILGT